ncbi:MAG TPA: DUF6036 family nucleotidyltransferase, partial [Beijerinckiaceae bacterium]|nr:DUF6036 family nucleotidyltransferase [Beijerinckiaceae bacterium]
MKFGNINHVLRAASNVTGHDKFVVVGASAVIARLHGLVSVAMTATAEVDIYAFDAENAEHLSDMIDANIGQESRFHSTFGYYADGVSPETAKMPTDWMTRAVRYNPPESPAVTAILPDVNDIALAKMVAWREKDIDWLAEGAETGVLSLNDMNARVP